MIRYEPLFVLAILAAAPLGAQQAQERPFEARVNEAIEDAKKPAGELKLSLSRGKALATTLTAMGDGPKAGGMIISFLAENNIAVDFKEQAEPSSRLTNSRGKTTISLSESLPPYPRVYAPRIARESAALMFSDMPDCAEREYMRLSLEVRSWLELGGEKASLPVIETLLGYKDELLSERFKLWLDDAYGLELVLERIGKASGRKPLAELQLSATSFEVANQRFLDFMTSEQAWRKVNSSDRR
jgi:hypothetical protein